MAPRGCRGIEAIREVSGIIGRLAGHVDTWDRRLYVA